MAKTKKVETEKVYQRVKKSKLEQAHKLLGAIETQLIPKAQVADRFAAAARKLRETFPESMDQRTTDQLDHLIGWAESVGTTALESRLTGGMDLHTRAWG